MSAGHDGHPHDHPQDNRHTAYGGPVMLDVGDGIGALVLITEPAWAGAEIEISPFGRNGPRTHVGVHPRTIAGQVVHAAVYPDLSEGDYQLWAGPDQPALVVHVTGGAVTQEHWTEPAPMLQHAP